MAIRDWLRPPRQVLVVFLGVALLSTGALGWLAWLVLEQDRELATQRLRLEIEQAAESAVGAMQQSLASLIALVAQPPDATPTLPADLAFVRIEHAASTVLPAGASCTCERRAGLCS